MLAINIYCLQSDIVICKVNKSYIHLMSNNGAHRHIELWLMLFMKQDKDNGRI